jgi:hypothetical protein
VELAFSRAMAHRPTAAAIMAVLSSTRIGTRPISRPTAGATAKETNDSGRNRSPA